MNKNDVIYVAGHNGMVGSAILRKLKTEGYSNLIFLNSSELDLCNQNQVEIFFKKHKPDYVFLCAAKVGGIKANDEYSAEFIYQNLLIQSNVIHNSYLNNVKKLIFLGSSCIYPKTTTQPIKEEFLLEGPLEISNQAYAIAKISGLEMCRSYNKQYGCNFISVMPTNLYGPNDNYDPKNSHVFAALILKILIAKKKNESQVNVWGSGEPKREFLHVDDLADACLFLMKNYNSSKHINVGWGKDISINELALLISDVMNHKVEVINDKSKLDGTMLKKLDCSKLENLGWKPKITLKNGIEMIYQEIENKINV